MKAVTAREIARKTSRVLAKTMKAASRRFTYKDSGTRTKATGVTFIELVIVLAVFAVMSTLVAVLPAERRQLSAAARQVADDIRLCQRLAMSEGKRTRIKFDESSVSYTIETMENGKYESIKHVPSNHYIKYIDAKSTNYIITFTVRGTTGDACTIHLYTLNYTLSMTVNVGAGRVKLGEVIKNGR